MLGIRYWDCIVEKLWFRQELVRLWMVYIIYYYGWCFFFVYWRQYIDGQDECSESFISGGMWFRCICLIMICCCGEGMLLTLKVSGSLEFERIIVGSVIELCFIFLVRLNCCCKMVDLWRIGGLVIVRSRFILSVTIRYYRCY